MNRFASSSGLLLVALLLPANTALAAGNLLTNPAFESGFTGWTQWGSAPSCAHAIVLGGPGSGNAYSLVDSSTAASCGLYQAVPVTPGLHYHGEVTVTVASGTVQLYLRWVDAFGNDAGPSFPVDTSSGVGTQVLAAHGDAPVGAAAARFWLYCATSNACSVTADDANFEQE